MTNLSDIDKWKIVQFGLNKGQCMENWRIYQDAHGEWRWWKLNKDGNIIQASELGFDSKEQCENNAVTHGYVINQ